MQQEKVVKCTGSASPHFVTHCKNRGMMMKTKYVVVVHFFSTNKVEKSVKKFSTRIGAFDQ